MIITIDMDKKDLGCVINGEYELGVSFIEIEKE
jgi:hypothetical protein